MGETTADITGNDADIPLREFIRNLCDHLDAGIHDIRQELSAAVKDVSETRALVAAMHEELEAARPMIEKWQHSKIRKLAAGQMPWQA